MTPISLSRLSAGLLALCASLALAAPLPIVPGEPVPATQKAAASAKLRLQAKSASPRVSLPAVTEDEVARVRNANLKNGARRFMIGVNRAAPASAQVLSWEQVEGGQAARLSASSPGAEGLRLAIDLRGVPLDTEMVFVGSGDQKVLGPVRVGSIDDRFAPWWSPATEGEEQTVEFFSPGGEALAAPRVTSVSHLFTSAGSLFRKRASDIGDSGSCNVDIKCIVDPSQALLNARNSVAKMLFTAPEGTSLCTGTLLNDTNPSTVTPWFYGANHCFDVEMAPFRTPAQLQSIASTLNTYWFFEAVACNDRITVPPFVQLFGGATYLFSNVSSDVLFLRLNEPPPAGAFLTGWDANPVPSGANVIGLHHPLGDLKKISQGAIQRFSSLTLAGTPTSFIEVLWNSGTTEGGSSGSGLWTFSGSAYVFRGGLWGGTALCTNLTGTDNYSRFDQAYPSLVQYLGGNTPTTNYTDLWWDPNESGWGLNLTQHPSNIIFGVWYTYGADGKRLWIVMPSGAWISPTQYTGQLFITSGPPASSAAFNPNLVKLNAVGNGTLSFSDANNGTWSYTVNGQSGVKTITRQPF